MFTFPNIEAFISIVYPVGNYPYKWEWQTKTTTVRGKKTREEVNVRVNKGAIEARLGAVRDVASFLFVGIGEAAIAASALVGALEARERFFQ